MIIRGKALTAIKQEQRRKKLKHRLTVAGLVLVNIIVFTGAAALAFRLPALRINNVVVQGVGGERLAEVNTRASGLLKEKKWMIFPRYTTISSPNQLASSVEAEIPWIEKADASIDSHTMQLNITERRPAYVICVNNALVQCYYADINTLVFAEAPDFSAPVYPELASNKYASSTAVIMTSVFDRDTSQKIQDLQKELSEQKIILVKFEETNEGSFRAHTKGGWYIYFTRDEPVQTVGLSLRAAMNSESFAASFKKNPGSLEYVDVRLADKVFYKFNKAGTNATTTPAQ